MTGLLKNIIWSFFLILGMSFSITALAGIKDHPSGGARSRAMGNVTVTLSDVFSAANNQAGLGFLNQSGVGAYAGNAWLVAGLNAGGAVGAIATGTGTFGLSMAYSGNDLFQERQAGIGFGKAFGSRFSAGLQLDYMGISIREYGSRNTFSFQAGFIFSLIPKVKLGAHVVNPARMKMADFQNERLPTILRFGADYTPSEKLIIAGEVEKDIEMPANFKFGIEYLPVEKLAVRAGFVSESYQFTFGTGILLKGLRIDLASHVHPLLGVSPHFSLAYNFSKKKAE